MYTSNIVFVKKKKKKKIKKIKKTNPDKLGAPITKECVSSIIETFAKSCETKSKSNI